MSNLKDLGKRYQILREEFERVTLEELKLTAKEIFDKYPKLEKFGWLQFAPHFNDGEPCEFSKHEMSCYDEESAGLYASDEDYNWLLDDGLPRIYIDPTNTRWNSPSNPKYPELEELDQILYDIPDEVLKVVFGPDSKIVVTREGIEITDYSGEHG
jgi:hypothetical protein